MKRLISLVMVIAMMSTLLFVTNVSATEASAENGKLIFFADFDKSNPTPICTDGNVTVVGGTDGYAARVSWNNVGYGGAAWQTADFELTSDTVFMFDILNNSATNNVNLCIRDKNGAYIGLRFKNAASATNYIAPGIWYTYAVRIGATASEYVAYRKAYGTSTWEMANVEKQVTSSTATASAGNNIFKLSWGSSSAGSGAWYVDNVAVFNGMPAMNVVVPENPDQIKTIYAVNDNLNGDSCIWSSAASAAYADIVTDTDDATNKIFEVDGSKAVSADYRGVLSGMSSQTHILPSREQGYTVSFDFRKVEDGLSNDQIWIKTGKPATATGLKEDTTARIYLSQFETGVWYRVSYTVTGTNTTCSAGGTKTNLTTGEETKLTATIGTQGWTGAVDNFTVMPYNNTQRKLDANWTYSEENPDSPWKGFRMQMDNMSLTYDAAPSVKADILMKNAVDEFKPLVVAYDSLGIATAVVEGDATTIDAVDNYAHAGVYFDIASKIDAFKNAKTVKVLSWDGYNTANSYFDAVDISEDIAQNAASTLTAREMEITSDIIPAGATGKYTLMAYTVPFNVSKEGIPAYNAAEHKLIAIQQSETAPEKFVFDSVLYNGEKEDIVILCNADGAEAPVITLYEENVAPSFKNISMLLGKDITERNFTWYSLNGEAGKITYQKKSEMVDGEFSANALVVDATRCHADDVYSSKEFYYQNQAVMTGLEPGETYVYQLSNGATKSEKYTTVIGEKKSSFSFLFGGDPQLGGNNDANYDQETLFWGRTVEQMFDAPEFQGVEFFVSAGDQIETGSSVEEDEAQYDIYLERDEFKSLPMAVVLGNHDAKTAGTHMQHFNEPNKIINPETGRYYGESGGSTIDGVDYYYVYNSVLFMHINLNTFDDLSNGDEASRLDDKADADEHAAFINAVLEETKDNKDILWKVVTCHQSPFGSSYHNNYKLSASGKYSRPEQYDYINIREYLVPYLYEAGVDLVLSGHDHTYTRSHVIKPNENDDVLGDEVNSVVITPYANTSGSNYYTYADGTTTPTFDNGTDGKGWKDKNNKLWMDLKVKSKPVKVTDPDGFVWVTGSSSSGSQINSVEYLNHYAAVGQMITQRSLTRIDVKPDTLKLVTYNLGTNEVSNNPLVVVDEFEIVRTVSIPVAGVTLDESAEIAVGQTKALNAVLSPVEPTNKNVTWTSDNEDVATVDGNGVVTAKTAGTANITVTTEDGGFAATCAVTVVQGVPVTEIILPASMTMSALATKTLDATVAPEGATTKEIKWTSSDERIATVDANGNVTAHLNGEVTITATATDGSGVSASCLLNITYVPMTRFEINTSEIKLDVMEEAKLSYAFSPADATFTDVVWSSSAPDIVSVDKSGKIEALKVGSAEITATNAIGEKIVCNVVTDGGVNFVEDFEGDALKISNDTAWTVVTEEDGNKVYEIDGTKFTSFSNIGYQLDTGMYNSPIATSEHTISFDYKRMAEGGYPGIEFKTYDHDGIFGGARVSIQECEVGVWYNIKLVYSDGKWTKYIKKATDAEYTVQNNNITYGPSNHTQNIYYDRIWIAPWVIRSGADMNNGSDSSTAARLANAQKTAFRFDNFKVSTGVPATGMTLAKNAVLMNVGATTTINPIFSPSNATDTNVCYTSSNTAVATVDRNGKVTAIGAGSATITAIAADGGYSASYEVTVKDVLNGAAEVTFLGAQEKNEGTYSIGFGLNAELLLSDTSALTMVMGDKAYTTDLFGANSIINWLGGYLYTEGEKAMFAIQIDNIGAEYMTEADGKMVPKFKLYFK